MIKHAIHVYLQHLSVIILTAELEVNSCALCGGSDGCRLFGQWTAAPGTERERENSAERNWPLCCTFEPKARPLL